MKNPLRTSSRANNVLTFPIPQRLFAMPKINFLVNLKFLLILSAIFLLSFLTIYIFQISTVISQGYQIQNYQKKISDISQENKILEIKSADISSLENIDSKIQELGFEKIDKIYYIQILEGSVVKTNNKIE